MNEVEGEQQLASSFISIRKVILLVLFGAIVYLIIALLSNFDEVSSSLSQVSLWTVFLMMGLSFLNYIIRYIKWQYYLHRIDIHLSHTDSFSIFLAGFTLTTTPGKIGEGVKGVFINDIQETPLAKTMPVVVSERVTDLLAMVILAMIGFLIGFTGGQQLEIVLLVGCAALLGALILGNSSFYNKVVLKMTSFGPLKRFQNNVDVVEDTMTKTLSPRPMALSTAISVPGWFMECLELWLLLSFFSGAGLPSLEYSSLILLLQATFIHATSSAIGAVSFLPGGIGGYEGVSLVLLTIWLGFPSGAAGASIILIRFVTLWFSVIIGFIALAIVETRRKRRESTDSP